MYTCNGNPIFYLFDATDMLTILNDKEKKRVCTDKKSSTWCRLRNMFFHDCQHRTMKRNCKATCHFCRKLNNCCIFTVLIRAPLRHAMVPQNAMVSSDFSYPYYKQIDKYKVSHFIDLIWCAVSLSPSM